MKITQEADYALRMMYRLTQAAATGNAVVGAATLAEGVAVPTRFGLKILHKLSVAGLVKTSRGISGGYSLNRAPDELTVRQIIEAVDGPIALNRCLCTDYDCLNNPDKSVCRLHHIFETLNAQITERLDRLTLSLLTDADMELGTLLAVLD